MKPLFVRLAFVLVATCIAPNLIAQQDKVDSLESLIKSVPADTTKVWLLNQLVVEVRNRDTQKALSLASEAVDLAQVLSYDPGMAHAMEHIGWIQYRQGDYDKGFETSYKALKLYEQLDNQHGVARALINLAAIHYQQKQIPLGIQYFRRAYIISSRMNDKHTMARSLNNLTFGYLQIGKLDSAGIFVKQAIKIARETGDRYLLAYAHRCVGDIHIREKQFETALKYYKQCLEIGVEDKNTFLQVSTLHRLGEASIALNNYDQALNYLLKNVDLARRHGYREELERTYKFLSEAYRAKSNIVKAFEYQSRYIALHDSLFDKRQADEIALLQNRFNSEINKAQIDLLTKEAAIQAAEIKSQKIWMYFFIGCLSLVAMLVFVLLYINRYTGKAKSELEEKNIAINRQAHQLKNLNATKDKLFSIISHDLRSPLTSLKALMELVGTPGLTQEEFVNLTNVLRRNLDAVYGDLDNLLMWAQSQLKGLNAHPEMLDLREVVNQKFGLFAESANAKNISLVNQVPAHAFVMADKNHIALIMRNLLANAIKFSADGGAVIVSSERKDQQWQISVTDSGVGISSDDIDKLFNAREHFTKPGTRQEKGVGIGLLLTKEFVELNKGEIWVVSELGKGTSFTFSLPAAQRVGLATPV